MIKATLSPLLISLCLVGANAGGETLGSYWHNRQGLKQLRNKSNLQAYREFLMALESEPLNPEVQMNLGLTFIANEEWEKAEAAYRGVLNLLPEKSERRFEALFNLAYTSAKLEKIEQALQHYQEALEIHPDSLEVKTNIELLFAGGKGGGKGKNKDDKQKKDDKSPSQDQQNQRDDPGPQDKKKQQPKPFESQDLSKEDVKRILDEIKNQEQNIRAQEYDRNKSSPGRAGKDW